MILSKAHVLYGLELLLFSTIVFVCNPYFYLHFNEMDIIPYAKATYGDFLTQDWYLNLNIPYRYLFSHIVGFFIAKFGVVGTVFTGRLISYLLFSVVFIKLCKTIKQDFFYRLGVFLLLFIFFRRGMGAGGEWMIGGLDTKVFAYCFALLSLTIVIQKKYYLGLLYAGFSFSFHVLIGGYNIVCLLPIFIVQSVNEKSTFLRLIKSSFAFLISASFGLYATYIHFTEKIAPEIAQLGWEIYVEKRVPHHVVPNFSIKTLVLLVVFTVVVFVFYKRQNKVQKYIALYALSSVGILVIGLVVYAFLDATYLRYYFFRFCDVILPLITIILLGSLVKFDFLHRFLGKIYLKTTIVFLFVLGLGIVIYGIQIPKIKKQIFTIIENKTCVDSEMTNWIKKNTTKDAVFCIPPDNRFFYMNAERAILVSYKNSPQAPQDIIEWYERMKLLNGNSDFNDIQDVYKKYHSLQNKDVELILKRYPEVAYFLVPNSVQLKLPVVFQTNKQKLYRTSPNVEIKNKES